MGTKNVQYRESVYVGYRYFDSANKPVRYPFGFGLSYTTFEYSNLQVSSDTITDADVLTVTFDVKNTGKVAGAEVSQVYVKDVKSTIFRPEKELKGFDKVYLDPAKQRRLPSPLTSARSRFTTFSFTTGRSNRASLKSLSAQAAAILNCRTSLRSTPPRCKSKIIQRKRPRTMTLRPQPNFPLKSFRRYTARKYPKISPRNAASLT